MENTKRSRSEMMKKKMMKLVKMIPMLHYMEAVDLRAGVINAESMVINQKTAQNAR